MAALITFKVNVQYTYHLLTAVFMEVIGDATLLDYRQCSISNHFQNASAQYSYKMLHLCNTVRVTPPMTSKNSCYLFVIAPITYKSSD